MIPNLRFVVQNPPAVHALTSTSYISEAAASLLDERLQLYIVPPTQLVSLSSSVGVLFFSLLLLFPYVSLRLSSMIG